MFTSILDFDGVTNVTQCKDYKCGGHQGTHIGHIQVDKSLKHGLIGIHYATYPVRLLFISEKKQKRLIDRSLHPPLLYIEKKHFSSLARYQLAYH